MSARDLPGEADADAGQARDGASFEPQPWLSVRARDRWWTVTVLSMMLTLSFLDRNLLKLLVEPVKADLGVTDLQISLLVGISFSILYSISCVPFGYAADILNRRKLIGGAVVVWSGMSMMCGFANNYWQLFIGRAGLGVGEAALQPAAVSLIRDNFAPQQRARAFSIFGIGPLLGSGLAMFVGGALFAFAEAGLTSGIPVLGALKAWQFALVAPGAVGVLLALLLLTVREPKRPATAKTDAPTFGELFRHMSEKKKLYLLLFAAPTVWSLAGSGWNGWMAAGIGRTWDLTPGEIGMTAGPIALICTPVGLISMGFLMDHLARKGHRDAIVQVTLAVQLLHMIPALMIFIAPTVETMWLAFGASMLITGTIQTTGQSILSEFTPSRLIGKAAALFSMVQNFLGLAIGPTVYALVSQQFFAGERAIVFAMMACYSVLISISMALLIWLMRERKARQGR